jgi:hypothetical protein
MEGGCHGKMFRAALRGHIIPNYYGHEPLGFIGYFKKNVIRSTHGQGVGQGPLNQDIFRGRRGRKIENGQ